MKKILLFCGILLSFTPICFLKAQTGKGTASHYCVIQTSSPGHTSVDCTGDASACGVKADCLSN